MSDFDFSTHLKTLRKSKGMTAKSVHISAGIPYSTYMKYEQGQFMPTIPAIKAIAKALHCTTDELLGYSLDNDEYARVKAELTSLGCIIDDTATNGSIEIAVPIEGKPSYYYRYLFTDQTVFTETILDALNKAHSEFSKIKIRNINNTIDNFTAMYVLTYLYTANLMNDNLTVGQTLDIAKEMVDMMKMGEMADLTDIEKEYKRLLAEKFPAADTQKNSPTPSSRTIQDNS